MTYSFLLNIVGGGVVVVGGGGGGVEFKVVGDGGCKFSVGDLNWYGG
jgi:hypothetical protein